MSKVSVVVPNWNGAQRIDACLDSLMDQNQKAEIIIVDNGSTDGSVKLIEQHYSNVSLIKHSKNLGFAGGVNTGIRYALGQRAKYIALLNNDAAADRDWLKNLTNFLDTNPKAGIATSKIIGTKEKHLDSTGECYSIWGLPFPRGRGEPTSGQYDDETWVFGGSGGASMYRANLFEQVGLFDQDFFAYYEDVDLSFRAQLAGWKVAYVPEAVVYHEIGATSGQIKGFTTYHTLKNLPLLLWKNVPWTLMPRVWPRLVLAYLGIVFQATRRGQFGPLFKGLAMGTFLWPKKLIQRNAIQRNRRVTPDYIYSIMVHDLPPNARRLRNLRSKWWKLRGKK